MSARACRISLVATSPRNVHTASKYKNHLNRKNCTLQSTWSVKPRGSPSGTISLFFPLSAGLKWVYYIVSVPSHRCKSYKVSVCTIASHRIERSLHLFALMIRDERKTLFLEYNTFLQRSEMCFFYPFFSFTSIRSEANQSQFWVRLHFIALLH